jgi:apolipoprotein N-acyltransferase
MYTSVKVGLYPQTHIMKKIRISYWVVTVFFALAMTASAFLYFSRSPQIVGAMGHLGYPAYLLTILGTAKLLGVAALLQPRYAVLREWAYAGFTINLAGAAWSHAAVGDPVTAPLVLFALLALSYAAWKKLSATGRAQVTRTAAGSRLAA